MYESTLVSTLLARKVQCASNAIHKAIYWPVCPAFAPTGVARIRTLVRRTQYSGSEAETKTDITTDLKAL